MLIDVLFTQFGAKPLGSRQGNKKQYAREIALYQLAHSCKPGA